MSFAPATLLLRAANSTLLQSSVRTFAIPATAGKNHYKVLIAGGGTGGCAVAGRLRKSIKPGDLAVIEFFIYRLLDYISIEHEKSVSHSNFFHFNRY